MPRNELGYGKKTSCDCDRETVINPLPGYD
jgi:hypothetical protein